MLQKAAFKCLVTDYSALFSYLETNQVSLSTSRVYYLFAGDERLMSLPFQFIYLCTPFCSMRVVSGVRLL